MNSMQVVDAALTGAARGVLGGSGSVTLDSRLG